MGNKLFVGGLSWGTTDDGLRAAFSRFGDVTDAKVIMDRETGRSRGFGFVSFAEGEAAQKAIEGMNGAVLDGRTLKVNEAQERPRGPREGAPRGGPPRFGGGPRDGGGPPREFRDSGGFRGPRGPRPGEDAGGFRGPREGGGRDFPGGPREGGFRDGGRDFRDGGGGRDSRDGGGGGRDSRDGGGGDRDSRDGGGRGARGRDSGRRNRGGDDRDPGRGRRDVKERGGGRRAGGGRGGDYDDLDDGDW